MKRRKPNVVAKDLMTPLDGMRREADRKGRQKRGSARTKSRLTFPTLDFVPSAGFAGAPGVAAVALTAAFGAGAAVVLISTTLQ